MLLGFRALARRCRSNSWQNSWGDHANGGVSDSVYSNLFLRLDLVGPEKLPGSYRVDYD
jgi:hypothetical protein